MSLINGHRWWFVGAGVAALATSVLIVSMSHRTHANETKQPVKDTKLADLGFVCFGHVDVEQGIAPLYPVQHGRIVRVAARENQDVKKGDVLLSLDKRNAQCLVRQAKADLEEAKVKVEQSKKLVEQQKIKEEQQEAAIEAVRSRTLAAEFMLARLQELRRDGLKGSDKEVEASKAQVLELKAVLRGEEKKFEELRLNDPKEGVRRADAILEAKTAQLDQAELSLSECDLLAPQNGSILRSFVHEGEVLGNNPRQPAFLFCPDAPRVVRAEVEQEYANRLEIGQPATIRDDSSAKASWTGKVSKISDWYTHRRSILQEPLQWNDVRTLECVIAIDPDQPPLRIGQRVLVRIGK